MTVPSISAVRLSGARNRAELPLLLLGPSLGSSASEVWWPCVEHLADAFDLVAWDLPGHGHNRSVPEEPFTTAELAAGVLAVVDDVLVQREEVGGSFSYAGVGVGGEVGLQLMLDAPARVRDAVLVDVGEAFSRADVHERLGEIRTPAIVVVGAEEQTTPPSRLQELVDSLSGARVEVLDIPGRPTPAQAPARMAALVRHLALGERLSAPGADDDQLVRSLEELAAAHAGGRLWEHPGLDPRTRLLVALTARVVSGQHDGPADHAGLARTLGIDDPEIREVVLQAALHAADGDVVVARRIAESAQRDISSGG